MTHRYQPAAELAERLIADSIVSRIWSRDASAWNARPASSDAESIGTRLGWLDVGRTMPPHLKSVEQLADEARAQHVTDVYLLGMGGSSLCAEVLRSVYGVAPGCPELHVLDTTDDQTLTRHAGTLVPERTWFLVASKSGGTVEVASMERFFWERMGRELGDRTGEHFIAITDPGTALERLAREKRYRATFVNPPDIGGRFSALSLFGLVPTALIGASPRDLLAAGSTMAEGCRQENHANAGLELGAFIAASTLEGRDKLTVILPPSLATLGLWIEQLVAESTGKHGKGALPVVDEPIGQPGEYGQDRAFVALATDRDAPDGEALAALAAAGHPVLHLSTRLDALGAEFFRWEFATAIAGAALGINPFDEPNVAEAKERTKSLLDAYRRDGRLPDTPAVASEGAIAVHGRLTEQRSPAAIIRDLVDGLNPGDYVAFLSYLSPDSGIADALGPARRVIRQRTHAASTVGTGPRYLHSTGQYHKGGPNTAVAIVVTADDPGQTEIPGSGHSFAVLKRAQALGDVQALDAHERRVVRVHVSGDQPAQALATFLLDALGDTQG